MQDRGALLCQIEEDYDARCRWINKQNRCDK